MRNFSHLLVVLSIFCTINLKAQVDQKYMLPPQEILELADAKAAPRVRINKDASMLLLLERSQYKSIKELAQAEKKLAGLRINPKTNGRSRNTYYFNIQIKDVKKNQVKDVKGMPSNPLISNISWSHDYSKVAFTNTLENGIELWVIDVKDATAKKLTDAKLNAVMGSPFSWYKDSKSLLVKFIPENRKAISLDAPLPTGPIVSENNGQRAQNRTYADLLKNKHDEDVFDYFTTSKLVKVNLDGKKTDFLPAAIYSSASFSPDGEYLMIRTIERPYSYIVTLGRFPKSLDLYTKDGKHVKTLEKTPLTEVLPQGFDAVIPGKRSFSWRADQPATITYAIALDGGDPAKKVEFRDQVYQLTAPFSSEAKPLTRTKRRYYGITYGNKKTAMLVDYLWKTRIVGLYLFDPSKENAPLKVIQERSTQDKYSDMGSPATIKNKYGRSVLYIEKGSNFIMDAPGYSKEGQNPYISRYNFKTKKNKILWRTNNEKKLESISYVIDPKKGTILTSVESPSEYPNYYVRNFKNGKVVRQLTDFENPYKAIQGIHKEIYKYKRKDGVELSGTLYLPKGYDMKNKKRLPLVMWAYPEEFKNKSNAGQVTASSNEFTYVWYGSPIFWVTQGYAVLDDASFPIIGEGDEEPNDTFIEQLVANAEAAINALDKDGYIDRTKVAVGGHSYGAFMTANLLTHSDLFAAGIARSGAYNRTLTPFGFQSEERNYWEAPEIYNTMSPFMNADKMKHPLLLIHGDADNNSGTYTMQSKRYFNALKGLGGTVRMVLLPHESHGYRARESVMHVLWEQDQWLNKYLKNKK